MRKTLLCLVSLSFIIAEIQFSGDARFRPRYDIKENSDASSTSDLYYLYRARLNMKADIGDGWFFNTKLGTLGVAGMTKIGTSDNEPGNINSYRPTVSFMELYFGNKKEDWGFWAGAFPLKYNSSLDLHFYSDVLVDIPFVLLNNSSTLGFAGYKVFVGTKINWFVSVDNNVIEKTEFSDEDLQPIDDCDDFTLGMNTLLNFGSISITPRFLTSFGGMEDDIHPTTIGANISLPNILGFDSEMSYYSSTNGEDGDDGFYEADHMRVSLNYPFNDGKLKFFYDLASKNEDKVSYLWMSYTMPIYESDIGSVSITPTFRLQNGKGAGTESFDEEYSRSKIEVTTQIKFK
tara:strand:+ start:39 stop:1079 length:1041 start_codon:yes stop_codon:yes gene_type:complete